MRVRMGRFSLARLLTCARYERLTSEDYLRLGLCLPDSCPDCAGGQGHYVKNDKIMVSFQFFFLSKLYKIVNLTAVAVHCALAYRFVHKFLCSCLYLSVSLSMYCWSQ
jgi:hypothetical protein